MPVILPNKFTLATAVLIWAVTATVYWPSKPRTRICDVKTFEDSTAGNETRATVIHDPDDASGDYSRMRFLSRPGIPGFYKGKSASPPLHTHYEAEECFKVISGRMAYILDGVQGFIGPDDEAACLPPGKSHTFWNAENATAMEFETLLLPPGNYVNFMRTVSGLGIDKGSLAKISPFQFMVSFKHTKVAMADVPRPVWLVIEKGLVPVLETVFGFRPFYPEYTKTIP